MISVFQHGSSNPVRDSLRTIVFLYWRKTKIWSQDHFKNFIYHLSYLTLFSQRGILAEQTYLWKVHIQFQSITIQASKKDLNKNLFCFQFSLLLQKYFLYFIGSKKRFLSMFFLVMGLLLFAGLIVRLRKINFDIQV